MNRSSLATIAFLACFISIWFWNEPAHAQEESIGIVTALKGTVTFESGGVVAEVELGTEVYIGDKFETGEDSGLKMLLDDDTLISLGENATFEISEFIYTLNKRKSTSRILKGKLKAVIQKFEGEDSYIEFVAPNGVAGIKGTVVFIDADRGIFYVQEGESFVRGIIPGAREIRLVFGEVTTIQPDGHPGPSTPIDPGLKDELEEGTDVTEEAPDRGASYKEDALGVEPFAAPSDDTEFTTMDDIKIVPPIDLLPGVNTKNEALVEVVIPQLP